MADPGADPKAVAVAKELRRVTDADCVVLFGSRARSDWTPSSDVDLMVLNEDLPDQPTILEIQESAARIAEDAFGEMRAVDVLFMTHEEFLKLSKHTINHVATRAGKEGIIMPRNPEGYGSESHEEYPDNELLEYQERERRIGDANLNYRDMHTLLDAGIEDKNTAFLAQQAVENAMKSLISTLGERYNTHHSTRDFARDIRRLDQNQDWHFASNLGQLDNFAGAARYGPLITPIPDYREMANNVTDDLENIYQRIKALTGEDPWDILPEGNTQKLEPRWRTSR